MKITHNKVGQNLNLSDSARTERADKGKPKGEINKPEASSIDFGATKVDLSPRAQELKKAKEIAQQTPDINEEKVARLQKLIDEGKYKVEAKDIADKMVDEQLMWS